MYQNVHLCVKADEKENLGQWRLEKKRLKYRWRETLRINRLLLAERRITP